MPAATAEPLNAHGPARSLNHLERARVYCFDLRRAVETAELAFGGRRLVVVDARLREVDYGALTRRPLAEIDALRVAHAREPFPGGESYADATARLRGLLEDATARFGEGPVMLIGCRATYVGLEHLCAGVPLEEAAADPRPWQREWRYRYPGGRVGGGVGSRP